MVWLGGVDRGVWFAGICGLLCEMWAWVRHSGTKAGRLDPLLKCCVFAFRRDSWASADRALWSAFFAGLLFSFS